MGLHVVVVTGMSGAGRSTALHVLEDLGFFCVDNLPPALAPQLLSVTQQSDGQFSRIGLGVDVRTGAFLEGADAMIASLEEAGHEVELVFLDCADEVLVRRYSETRRPHPLAEGGDVLSGILQERAHLSVLRTRADHVLDTTHRNVHDLKRALVEFLSRGSSSRRMLTRIVSFGFKYGVPVDADLVFDLRYIPNPHFVPELKPQTGLDAPVSDFVLATEEAQELLGDLLPLLRHAMPRYAAEGKAYLTIAIGCTGGRHRSVAMTEELAKRLEADGEIHVAHRDVNRKTKR